MEIGPFYTLDGVKHMEKLEDLLGFGATQQYPEFRQLAPAQALGVPWRGRGCYVTRAIENPNMKILWLFQCSNKGEKLTKPDVSKYRFAEPKSHRALIVEGASFLGTQGENKEVPWAGVSAVICITAYYAKRSGFIGIVTMPNKSVGNRYLYHSDLVYFNWLEQVYDWYEQHNNVTPLCSQSALFYARKAASRRSKLELEAMTKMNVDVPSNKRISNSVVIEPDGYHGDFEVLKYTTEALKNLIERSQLEPGAEKRKPANWVL